MSNFYHYNFISPESTYAVVNEELKSYRDTGAIDSLLYPSYLDKCLRKLGKSSFSIVETLLYIKDFEARLPDNFYAAREAWMCININEFPYQEVTSFFSQSFDTTTIQIAPITSDIGATCVDCGDPDCNGECTLIQGVFKTNHQKLRSVKKSYLLKPGNISNHKDCTVDYTDQWNEYNNQNTNPGSSSYDSFDIRGNKFVTNFREGTVSLIFYSQDYDEVGNQLIPDNYRIREFIEAFLKYKMFELLTNQTNDETFNQLQQKFVYYKQQADETFILANIEIMKKTPYEKQRAIKQTLNRFNMYELPGKSVRYGRRRNS